MKKFSKNITMLILALVLILASISPQAAEAQNNGKITITNPTEGVTYEIYRVFDLTYSYEGTADNKTNEAYNYTAVSADLETALTGTDYARILTDKTNQAGRKIVNDKILYPLDDGTTGTGDIINKYDFSNWLYNNGKPADLGLVKVNDTGTTGTEGLEFSNLPLGYYLIKSSQGSIVSLNTTDTEVEVVDKNIKPTLTKQVRLPVATGEQENAFADSVYANIGENVNYQIEFTVPAHANHPFTLTDILGTSLDYVSGLKIERVDSTNAATDITAGTETGYTITKTSTFSGDTPRELKLTFPVETIRNLRNQTVRITYTAKLNNTASTSNHSGLVDNLNNTTLAFDPSTDVEDLTAKASVRTTDFNVKKYTLDGTTEKPLANAKFKIFTEATGGTALKFTKDATSEKYYHDPTGIVDEITTTTEGTVNATFNIVGLKPGTYYIEETAAPDGFNAIQGRIKLEIAEETVTPPATNPTKMTYKATIEETASDLTDNTVKIKNQSGGELPSTGGVGRTMIYTVGAILFIGSLVLIIARKRSKSTENNK
ncbi:MAG: isopeptide-forming domain-containing fimbrial protein [Clostridiaceae bacterium]|nr:isopeptide-forming domain-containing fimbrial protein [Clostridiaceae bacterium]